MNDLDELIKTADTLCNRLSKMAEDERSFGFDLCGKLEVMSWDAWRTANDLKELINHYGVVSC